MPFRSEGEQLREQIRRIEEQARELEAEQAALETQVHAETGRGGRAVLGLVVAVLALASATFLGFEAGNLAADKRAALASENLEREWNHQLELAIASVRTCERDEERWGAERAQCESEMATLRARAKYLKRAASPIDAPRPLR